jgi:alpha-tubulin suppressor-like RCC1 family protein
LYRSRCSHALARGSDGTVYSWGSNSHGELGLGDQNNRNEPTVIHQLSEVRQLLATGYDGDDFSFALTEHGRLYSFGINGMYIFLN